MKNTELRRRKNRIFITILFVLLTYCPFSFGAITITTPAGALLDGSAYPPLTYSSQFNATGDLTGIHWQLKAGFGVLPPGLTFDGVNGIIGGTPDISGAGKTYTFTVQVTNSAFEEDDKIYSISIIRLPIDLMLVLDNSLSMNCCYNHTPPDPTCVSCAIALDSRMARLKVAVDKFFTLGTSGMNPYFHTSNPTAIYNDNFGAVIFSGTLDPSHSNYVNTTVAVNALNTYIGALTTASGTCIGGGLLTGINSMKSQTSANHNKSLILFTDGEQNFNPMLKDLGAPVKYEAGALPNHPYDPSAPNPPYGDCMTFPASTPTFDNSFRTTDPAIKINTIGFEVPAGPGNQLLADLADPVNGAGGITNISGSMGTGFDDFTTFFTNAFVELLSGSSPQIVKDVTGTTKAGTNTVSFVVNDTVKKISFMLSGNAHTGDTLQFRVKKNNVDVTRLGIMIHKDSYNLWTIDFPLYKTETQPADVRPGGEWVLETTTVPGIKYLATCIVDDHLLNYKCSFGGTSAHTVGTPIPLSVSLSYRGQPVKDSATTVVVLVERTSTDGGTELAQLPVPQQMNTLLTKRSTTGNEAVDPGYNNLGQLKHYTLLQTEPKYAQALTPVVDSVILKSNGDGTYTGNYTPKVTGPYKFTFLIDGKDSAIGEFHRTSVKSSVVRLSHFDLSPENFKVVEVKTNGKLTGYTFNIIVKDSSGLLLGPAFGNVFDLHSSSGKFGAVTDNLDGSYSVTLTGLDAETDPQISIAVDGKNFYTGKVSTLGNSASSTLFGHWWFWLLLVLILILIIWGLRKKKP